MIGNVVVTAFVLLLVSALLFDLFTFWPDRTPVGNFIVGAAMILTIAWFVTGLYQLWK